MNKDKRLDFNKEYFDLETRRDAPLVGEGVDPDTGRPRRDGPIKEEKVNKPHPDTENEPTISR